MINVDSRERNYICSTRELELMVEWCLQRPTMRRLGAIDINQKR